MSARQILLKLLIPGVLVLAIFGLISIIRSQKVIAAVGVNKVINFQGKVTNANGTNVTDGTYDFVIKLYDGAASSSTNSYTESWTSSALWSSTMSSAPSSGGESMTYSSNTNESTIKVGQVLWNTTKEEPVVVVAVNTGTNVITISPTRQAWATGDTVTNKIYVKDGTFKVAINSLNQDLSGVNFGTDNIFLGINFNADGEMKPRIQYTATPYAMNAEKVNGLTVTNTSDAPFTATTTLKIADGKTVIISNGLTFTGTDSTSFAFPSTGGNVVTEAFTQSLTNKTIGSTGLTFSAATTDVATGTNEDFSIVPNGSGRINLGTTTPVGLLTLDGKVTGKAVMTINQTTGADQDLFTASQAAVPKFVISNTGATSASGMLTFGDGTLTNNVLRTPFGSMVFQYKSAGNAWSTGVVLQEATGNVGVGATTPLAKLDVNGSMVLAASGTIDARSSGTLLLGNGTNTTGMTLGKSGGTLTLPNFTGNNAVLFATTSTGVLASATTSTAGQCLTSGASATYLPVWGACGAGSSQWTTATNDIYYTTGNVGIGSTAPLGLLNVEGRATGKALGIFNQNGGDQAILSASMSGVTRFTISGMGTVSTASVSGTTSNAAFAIDNTGVGDIFAASSSGLSRFVVKQNGSVGIGTTTPTGLLNVISTATTLQTTGLGYYYWNPSATTVSSNDLLTLDVGSNGTLNNIFNVKNNGSSVFSVSQSQVISNVPASFNAPGDVSVAYDLKFTNPIASYMRSSAPLYLVSGQIFNSSDLSLTAFNKGKIIADAETFLTIGSATVSAKLVIGTTTPNPFNIGGLYATNASTYGKAVAIFNQTENTDIFTASSAGTPKFTVANTGNIATTGTITGLTGITLASGAINVSASNGTASQCLLGGSTAAWGACGTGSNWTQNNGALRPNNGTLDILFGGTSTSSAKFSFLNMDPNSGNSPIASFAGSLRLDSKPNSTNAQQTTWTKVSQSTAGTIAASGTTAIASISASAIYNGSLYVGTYKDSVGSAEVYRYDAIPNTWTKVSQSTAGTLAASGTSGIGSISAMTVFDGYLYAGTSKMNAAEVYRYDGGTTWTKVSAATAGTIKTGGTSAIDGIASMAVFQGRIYAGTRETLAAQVYRYDGGNNWSLINATAGTFVTTNTVGVNAINSMAVYNGNLYLTTEKPTDADVIRYLGGGNGGTAGTFLQVEGGTTTSSYNVDGTALTNHDRAVLAVYNGSLIVGLTKANGADVLMMTGVMPGEAPVNTFSRLNQATGTMSNSGTANIDGISAITVYNGLLFIGTSEVNAAEIYRYTGTDQKFFKVSNATAGTIASGGTAAIDVITVLQPTNGDLYAGTQEIIKAEVYKYTASVDRSYGVEFHSEPTLAGGEQGAIDNYASIYYVASASANLGSAAGNTGSFVFSHGIQTRNGSYDVAEDYPTRDDNLESGDLVSIDTDERGLVKKSLGKEDSTVIGIFSEKPALRLSQVDATIDGARTIPVALAGRVPVKVSTENGPITSGDYLTSSSIPGVAMKAKKAGAVIGQAMGSFDDKGVGKVLVYIKSASYNGSIAESFANISTKSNSFGKDVLEALASQSSDSDSQIVTDTLVAGLQIVTPHLTAHEISVDTISIASSSALKINLGENGEISFAGLDNTGVIMFDSHGNATFGGTVTAKRIKAEQIEGIELVVDRLLNKSVGSDSAFFASMSGQTRMDLLFAQVMGVSTRSAESSVDLSKQEGVSVVSKDLRVKGDTLLEGIVSVIDTLTANNMIINGMSTFFDQVVFKKDVRFEGRPNFSQDTVGTTVIKKGATFADIQFKNDYDDPPIITASVMVDRMEDEQKRKAQDKEYLNQNVAFIITHRNKKGFTLMLKDPALQDIQFSWIALPARE